MKKERKLSGFLLLLLMGVGLLTAGCSGSSGQGSANDTGTPKEINLAECRIVYDKSDFMSRRYAYRLYEEVEELTGVAPDCGDINDADGNGLQIRIIETDDENVSGGKAQIRVEDNTVTCRIGSYYGFEAILDYIRSTYEENGACVFARDFEWTGDYLDGLSEEEASDAYAYTRGGDYRFMFYNVLFESSTTSENDKGGQRNYLQAQMIAQYMPDIIGMQERDKSKAEWAGEYDFTILLGDLGYAQLEVAADNSMDINMTPIFYRKDVMTPIESGYLNYKNQYRSASEFDIASKSMTWCLFESAAGDRFLVVSSHLCVQDDEVRVAEAGEMMEILNPLIEKYNVPVILGGDFNTKMTSNSYTYYVTDAGFLDVSLNASEFASKIRPHHDYPRYAILDNLDFNGMYPPISDEIVKDFGTAVDHILLKNGDNIQLNVYGVVVDNCTLSGSDHFPAFIDFSVKK